ncbi:alpha/beta fold hydrolase [Nonomuraea sp. NPDC048826]|uniref:alpha/beta fold hydrolase n=1 Tax=Nonomuraea sp. NPDC048826 TaxID=3364347 RepID=UPI00371E4F5A
MGTVRSKDGTVIAFDAVGEGRPLIMVDGATAHRAVNPLSGEVGELLRDGFRTYSYDRRGRGQSGDTAPYATEREIEDLAALIEDAGAPAMVCGFSSGAALALDAAVAGLPIDRLVVWEPPFIVDDSRPPLPADYVERLDAAIAAGRPGDAVELFFTAAIGMPAEVVDGFRQSPMWAVVEEVAHTIAYDGRFVASTMAGTPLDKDRWASIDVPVLAMHGDGTDPTLMVGARVIAELLPTATLRVVKGEQHSVAPDVLAPVLRRFAETA